MILEVLDLFSGYGKMEVLKGVRASVPAGKIAALIGSNGAGKSTFLMTLSGILKAWKGTITFEGKSLLGLSPDAIVRLGVVQVPEGRRVFPYLTAKENLELGAYLRPRGPGLKHAIEEQLELFPPLRNRLKTLGGNLSGGEQQMLAMARSLMAEPRLLLLDEPSLGLAPKMVETVFSLIRRISVRGITILLVEQNAKKALELADIAFVLESGRVALEGTGKDLLGNPRVRESYLGG